MPAYSFKEQFCGYVEEGSKLHTMREERTGRSPHAKPGDTVFLYYGMRTKWCRKLAEGICTKVQKVTIYSGIALVNGEKVTDRDKFAWADGFRPEGSTAETPRHAWQLLLDFWRKTHDLSEKPWHGVIIHWKLKTV